MQHFHIPTTKLTNEELDLIMLYGPAVLGCIECSPSIKITINGEEVVPNYDSYIH